VGTERKVTIFERSCYWRLNLWWGTTETNSVLNYPYSVNVCVFFVKIEINIWKDYDLITSCKETTCSYSMFNLLCYLVRGQQIGWHVGMSCGSADEKWTATAKFSTARTVNICCIQSRRCSLKILKPEKNTVFPTIVNIFKVISETQKTFKMVEPSCLRVT